jgi:hypothetical protein
MLLHTKIAALAHQARYRKLGEVSNSTRRKPETNIVIQGGQNIDPIIIIIIII